MLKIREISYLIQITSSNTVLKIKSCQIYKKKSHTKLDFFYRKKNNVHLSNYVYRSFNTDVKIDEQHYILIFLVVKMRGRVGI